MNTGHIIYQVPGVEDAAAIALLHLTSWKETYSGMIPPGILENADLADRTARWRTYLEVTGAPTYLARANGEAAGFIRAGPVKEPVAEGADGHIFALYILKCFHRLGIGRRLIGLAAWDWVNQGGKALSVGVLTANQPACAFYGALGARFVRPDVYPWDGHNLAETIYIFDNLDELARAA